MGKAKKSTYVSKAKARAMVVSAIERGLPNLPRDVKLYKIAPLVNALFENLGEGRGYRMRPEAKLRQREICGEFLRAGAKAEFAIWALDADASSGVSVALCRELERLEGERARALGDSCEAAALRVEAFFA